MRATWRLTVHDRKYGDWSLTQINPDQREQAILRAGHQGLRAQGFDASLVEVTEVEQDVA